MRATWPSSTGGLCDTYLSSELVLKWNGVNHVISRRDENKTLCNRDINANDAYGQYDPAIRFCKDCFRPPWAPGPRDKPHRIRVIDGKEFDV